jgi:hypothetical protein
LGKAAGLTTLQKAANQDGEWMPLIEKRTAVTGKGFRIPVEIHVTESGGVYGTVSHTNGKQSRHAPAEPGQAKDQAIRRTICDIEDSIDRIYGPSTWE